MGRFQIRTFILYEYQLQHKAKVPHKNFLKVFGEDSITLKSIQLLYKKFWSSDFDVQEKESHGWPSLDIDEKLKGMLEWSMKGIFHYEFIKSGQTVNSEERNVTLWKLEDRWLKVIETAGDYFD